MSREFRRPKYYFQLIFILSLSLVCSPLLAGFGGGRGGGGGISRGGGGGGRPGGGVSRPAPRPNVSVPNISRPAPKPNISRPAAPQRPSVKPNLPSSRPTPQIPSGGLKPSTRPSIPNQLPSQRPSLPNQIQRPGSVNRPDLTRPANRPPISVPGIPNRPEGRPQLPSTRPNLPEGLPQRPSTRPNLPNNRPSIPGNLPTTRPNPGDLSDFLGMQKPIRPQPLPETLPGRPGLGNPPGGIANRPGGGNTGQRPDWINRPGINNPNINKRPGWINIDNSTNININNRWNQAINRRPGFATTLPANRIRYWDNWGSGVRGHWNYHRYHGCFNDNWWSRHYHPIAGWHYCHWYNRYPYRYWWRRPAWTAFGTWFVWSAAYQNSWQQPVYYDYGTGGNVVYENNQVYIAEQPVATTEEFAMSAADLATVPPPESQELAEAAEWMPLGTFALSTGESDVDPSRVVQLAIDREGIVSGTLYNTGTDQTQTIQGQVDRETQRVAFRLGGSETLVAETGLYNLTQDEAPLLVHFGTEKTETYLLIRLDEPAEE